MLYEYMNQDVSGHLAVFWLNVTFFLYPQLCETLFDVIMGSKYKSFSISSLLGPIGRARQCILM